MVIQDNSSLLIGDTPFHLSDSKISGEFVQVNNEAFYKITNYDQMSPFFMSLISSHNHWLFISSNGGLTAGRVDCNQALFPYYTEDKLTDNCETTGSKTIFRVTRERSTWLWEPFSTRQQGQYHIQRNLYKNVQGTTLIFEEINHSLDLTFRYAWRTGNHYGFVKTARLNNQGLPCQIEILDGLQNIMPAFSPVLVQNALSCLLDAYKRSEVDANTGLAIYALNATLTDAAEPSESLFATTVFQLGLDQFNTLLSSDQLEQFRSGAPVVPELEVRGKRGAFFVHSEFSLEKQAEIAWHIAADIYQDSADIVRRTHWLKDKTIDQWQSIEADLAENKSRLTTFIAAADGLQATAKSTVTAHHFANVMFNVMRGGIFHNQYRITKTDFINYIDVHNKPLLGEQKSFFDSLPEQFSLSELSDLVSESVSSDLIRLSKAYLPLTFSRRHGDPSRPWNRFSINIKNADGSQKLDYEGNWRDIFQNWEALALSYPEFLEGMVSTFLNATTIDGYNPYRITRSGIEWEVPAPNNPWGNFGYWSDHQIIYLLKLLGGTRKFHPDQLLEMLDRPLFSYANVPYRIKPYTDLLKDPHQTIQFEADLHTKIEENVKSLGTDARLLRNANGQIIHHSLVEKLLTLLLAKLVNLVPEGGIWMNTQRPEWNDANNALVGNGLSVVTLGYLYRFVGFFRQLLHDAKLDEFKVSVEIQTLLTQIATKLNQFTFIPGTPISDSERRSLMNALGQAGSDYRWNFYQNGLSGNSTLISCTALSDFLENVKEVLLHSLRANQREDDLYHAYNILALDDNHASIKHLDEMLEGQVSILSSGLLSVQESLALLESLRHSRLYREDQKSYLLYPNKSLPGFVEKNTIPGDKVKGLKLPVLLDGIKDKHLLVKDANDDYHFSGFLHNQKDVRAVLGLLGQKPELAKLVKTEGPQILSLFENLFKHSAFTGRSGTFFAYEGLGSIYWHMVSKLLLAVQETIIRCEGDPSVPALIKKYREIQAGLSVNKSPVAYGAFPTDPYSHTPQGGGAKQPGMTGLVKEEILTRQAEVGLTIQDGCMVFNPLLVDRTELISEPTEFSYVDITGQQKSLDLPVGSLAYTFCQTPIVLRLGSQAEITIELTDNSEIKIPGYQLDRESSEHIFKRDGMVKQITITII